MTPHRPTPTGFGLIIIGSEILDGRRQDSHFAFCRDLLAGRSIPLLYTMILPDSPALIEDRLQWAYGRPEPFFCCGGIGATPDDYTRQCAAAAAGVGIEPHPDGVRILTEKYGSAPAKARLRLVEFPAGCSLIPNSFNNVPGFTCRNGHFVPGFPEMARPMMTWVMDTLYGIGAARVRHTLILPGAREGDLIGIMEKFTAAYPALSFASLPRFVPGGTEVELSFAGPAETAAPALEDLTTRLREAGVSFKLTA